MLFIDCVDFQKSGNPQETSNDESGDGCVYGGPCHLMVCFGQSHYRVFMMIMKEPINVIVGINRLVAST